MKKESVTVATNNDHELEDKVMSFVVNETRCNIDKLNINMGLYHDLGVDGQDALELIEAFSKEFNVDTFTPL